MKVTGERDGFAIRGLDYFENLYDCLQPGDARLFLTKLEPKLALDQQMGTLEKAERDLAKIERSLENGDGREETDESVEPPKTDGRTD